MNKLSIIGASGHAKVIFEIAEILKFNIDNIFDQDINKEYLFSHKINHDFSKIPKFSFIAIGNNIIRKKIASKFSINAPKLIHPSCNFSKYSNIGDGTVVMPGVSINADVEIGKYCILNTNCSVDHDCKISDFVHISPNAAIAGNVEIGECTHIGIGACIKQGVKIGSNCVIGAGAVIIRDVQDGKTVIGNPGKELSKNK